MASAKASNDLEVTVNARNLFAELKRRDVYKVTVAYAVVAWLLIQVASIFLPTFDAPAWLMKAILVFLALGFVCSVMISWAFEITPTGIRRTADLSPDKALDIVRQLEARDRQQFVRGYLFALIQAGVGDKTEMIDYLKREYLNHDNTDTPSVRVDPMFDLLHGDPRFQTFADKTPEATRIGIEPTGTGNTATGQVDLISEDAAKAKPDQAVREKNGEIHHELPPFNAMLLNEVLKGLRTVQDVAAEA